MKLLKYYYEMVLQIERSDITYDGHKTKTVGNRFEEAKSINLGLTVLSRVITGLSKKLAHVPYRDSVLTKVLKESLESTCCVSMLACISPGANDVNETISTLRFSNEAKQLKTKPLPARLLWPESKHPDLA